MRVGTTVDLADQDWSGQVGVVTDLMPPMLRDPAETVAMVCGPEIMMRFSAQALAGAGVPGRRDLSVDGAQHEVRHWLVRSLPAGSAPDLPRRAGFSLPGGARPDVGLGALTMKPKLAVWKFSSCDGCQLTLLDCEDELLDIAEAVDIAYFLEATRTQREGPYDISLVEGSISTAHEVERIQEIRRDSRLLITIGACATAGGIQALRNTQDHDSLQGVGLSEPAIHRRAGDLDADRRSRPGGL